MCLWLCKQAEELKPHVLNVRPAPECQEHQLILLLLVLDHSANALNIGKNACRLWSVYLWHEDTCTALTVANQNMLIYVFTGNYCSEVFYFLK